MPTVSVVTAVHPERAGYLPETWPSLASQDMPPGWDWEWLVQCDSTEPADQDAVRSQLPEDARISFGASRRSGPAIARTMTLARASGSIVKTLDADDWLAPGVLTRDIAAHQENLVGWSASRVVDVHPDGSHTPHHADERRSGRVRQLSVWSAWNRDYTILVHPATLAIKLDLLLAVGGWAPLPAGEDTGLLLALDAITDGWLHDETGMYYRRWTHQMSAQHEHTDPDELAARRRITSLRHDALNNLVTR